MRIATFFVMCLICFFHVSVAQISTTGDLYQHLENSINAIPGSGGNEYNNPTEDDLTTWENGLNELVDGNYGQSEEILGELGYALLEFTDIARNNGEPFYILEKEEQTSNFWGTYVFNPTSCREKLILQAPHPKFDSNTGKEAAYIFSEIEAGALFISGTHRCNNNTESSCSGTTSACGSNAAYKISDVAHNTMSIFQRTTEVVEQKLPASVFIQLHGFGQDNGDPDAILSNGTRITPNRDYISEITAALTDQDNTLTFKVAHTDYDWDKLLAFTNTQGRFINGSYDPCSTNATNSNGKFIHIEQAYAKLRSSTSTWDKMSEALGIVFACGEEVTGTEKSAAAAFRLLPNPFIDHLQIDFTEVMPEDYNFELYTYTGRLVYTKVLISHNYIKLPSLKSGIYLGIIRDNEKIIDQIKLFKN